MKYIDEILYRTVRYLEVKPMENQWESIKTSNALPIQENQGSEGKCREEHMSAHLNAAHQQTARRNMQQLRPSRGNQIRFR